MRTLMARQDLATTMKCNDEALAILQELLTSFTNLLGPNDIWTIGTNFNVGECTWRAGYREKGEVKMRQAVLDCERALGPEHPTTLMLKEKVMRFFAEKDSAASEAQARR